MRARPSLGKFLNFCRLSLCTVAWFCSRAHPGRHWPTCFDQMCGYPSEGPLTTLNSHDAPGMWLTPTQEITTCDMVRRKTKEKRGGHELCRACEPLPPSPALLQPRQNGLKCRQCHVWACNAACGRAVADLYCCRMSGVASHECQSQSCSQGLGSWAAKGHLD